MTDHLIESARLAIEALGERKATLSTAESCTGGLMGAALTAVPGSSSVFCGGLILYSNELKTALAGVDSGLIESHGAVSSPVVEAMAAGAVRKCRSDFALAVSGVAGPGGGSPEKPVGTVWIGLADKREAFSRLHHFTGDRESVREQAAETALQWLIQRLNEPSA